MGTPMSTRSTECDRPRPADPRRRRVTVLLMTTVLAWGEMPLLPGGGARAQPARTAALETAPQPGPSPVVIKANIQSAQHAVAARPDDEAAARNLIDVLTRGGRNREALAEADRFMHRGAGSAALKAQRGYLRQELGDPAGAAEDFAQALAGGGLSPEQAANVQAGLAQAQAAQAQSALDRAQGDLARGDFVMAANAAGIMLASHPDSEAAERIRVEALASAGRTREALADADQFVARAGAGPLLLAQRGFLRRELGDPQGAADDFAAAMAGDGLAAEQRHNLEAGLAEATAAAGRTDLDRADAALGQRDDQAALAASQTALDRDPGSEDAIRIRVEALSRLGRKREAAAAADGFIAHNAAGAVLRAQRGFIRRELRDTAGAGEDFAAALAGEGLSAEQRQNVQTALAEAQAAGPQNGSNGAAARPARKGDAQTEANRLLAQGHAPGWAYAQRGNTRFDAGDFHGAVADFDTALSRRDLDRRSLPGIRFARAQAAAMLAEQAGKPQEAEDAYRKFLETEPAQADAWYKLGYLLLKLTRRPQAVEALGQGLAIRPVGAAELDAANAAIFTNAPLASKLYREGLDRWYAGDPSLSGRSQTDLERIKNEVVQADASVRTSMGAGSILGRPETAGGTDDALGAETSVRFDGRYLPAAVGLEAFVRGLTDKDATGTRETETAVGARYRPIDDLNLYFGGSVDHFFFQPSPITELVLNWGLGLGENPYPYAAGWKPYWDFSTIGAWRTYEDRVLEDTRGNVGFLYEFRAPVRSAIGPTLLTVVGYDNKAAIPVATGIGPSVLSYFWLGGDKYRSYDAVLSVQVGYVLSVGADERQRGWRGQIGVTF
jgi:tetratricopeptide (TPR) repeat protein